MASSPACPASLLRDLAQHPVPVVAHRAISNPNCPGDTVDRLAAHPDPAMQEAALAHPSCPLKTIQRAARRHRASDGSMPPAARGAARNPNCPEPLLDRLVRSGDGARLVAAHAQCPTSTLKQLAAHPEQAVRRAVAANPISPAGLLESLAVDAAAPVRAATARNPSSGWSLLVRLAADRDASVRVAAVENRGFGESALHGLANDAEPAVRAAVAGRIAAMTHLLARLASDDEPAVRNIAARSPHTPPEALEGLAADPDETVRWTAVANNASMSQRLLRELAQDPDAHIAQTARRVLVMQGASEPIWAAGRAAWLRSGAAAQARCLRQRGAVRAAEPTPVPGVAVPAGCVLR